VSSDDKSKPAVEQPPPDLEELAEKYVWDFLRRYLSSRNAVIILLFVVFAWSFRSEITEVLSSLYVQIVEWWPLPKAQPDVFTVALARLEGDDEKTHIEPTLG
jgi:hypothetical protein